MLNGEYDYIPDVTGAFDSPGATDFVGDLPLDPQLADLSLIERFRQEAAGFQAAYRIYAQNRALALASGLEAEVADLDQRAGTAQSYIMQVSDAAGSAWGWAKSSFGLAGARLGAVPLVIPIAAAAIVAMIAWVVSVRTDLAKFNARVAAIRSGVDPKSLPADSTATGDMTSLIKWGIVAGLVFTLAPPVMRAIEGKR